MINNWGRLKENCPLDINDLCDIGWSLQMELDTVKRSSKIEDIFLTKSKLNRIIKRFLGVISETNGTAKEDKEVEHEFREAYARILGNIDKKEDELKTKNASVLDTVAIPLYISEIESVLEGDIYDPIKRASEIYPNDKKMFVLKAFEFVNKSAQIFGGETRFRPTRKLKEVSIESAQAVPMTAEEMARPEGKKILNERFDRNFGYEEFKKTDELLKR